VYPKNFDTMLRHILGVGPSRLTPSPRPCNLIVIPVQSAVPATLGFSMLSIPGKLWI
jgi:hypothetical protein